MRPSELEITQTVLILSFFLTLASGVWFLHSLHELLGNTVAKNIVRVVLALVATLLFAWPILRLAWI